MKKKVIFLILFVFLVVGLYIAKELSKESVKTDPSWDRRPMLMYEDELYYYIGDKKEKPESDVIFDGSIESEVDASKVPFHNNQSNFGNNLSYRINQDNNQIEVYFGNDRWMIFSKDSQSK